jgi:3-deoxy-D-manno-octulosonic-acid transferase
MIAYFLYNILLLLALPLLAVYFLWRIIGSGKSRQAWREQLGFVPQSLQKEPGKKRIWVHAVSVGEAVASTSVIEELRKVISDAEIVLSTTTQTGQSVARKSAAADHYIYFPVDLPPAVKGAVDLIQPDVFVSMETEIWPNFLYYLGLRLIPAAIVNGIISDRTLRRSRPFRSLYKAALANVSVFCVQSQEDARRIEALGASQERVRVVGNTKFDQASPVLPEDERAELAGSFGLTLDDQVFVAGSTNPGEEEPILEAFHVAREQHAGLKLIIAPRQVERGEEIAAMCDAAGYSSGRRNMPGSLDGGRDVAILDTLGELAKVYALGFAAFVGGTFIPKGGHNILQPIAQGKPVFFGPHTFKIRDLVRITETGGVSFCVNDGRDLGERISDLLSDPDRLAELRRLSLELMRANRGASERCAVAVAELLESR